MSVTSRIIRMIECCAERRHGGVFFVTDGSLDAFCSEVHVYSSLSLTVEP
ncbi:hypothetical protein ALP29_201257 [Pseudomonas syringae pv. avii]|uniref:Uncharacterized protein n=1 Tax=Pseudomonas syringae pv. avii TaxID=663959 RepID=A0A3M5UG79_PSESX|nr:hypothetical protein ALP29_201257 [Pseudomonas syringae pv. avii]